MPRAPASRRKQSCATGWLASGAFLSSAVSALPAAGAAAAIPGRGSATRVDSWRSARATEAEERPAGEGAAGGGCSALTQPWTLEACMRGMHEKDSRAIHSNIAPVGKTRDNMPRRVWARVRREDAPPPEP
jgi:hypothetical protein